MRQKSWWRLGLFHASLAAAAWGGAFGKVVTIGGHASDLALDEARGFIYVANFTASQIEVISTTDLKRRIAMSVAAQPGSLALSPDGRFLVVTHFANYQPPSTAFCGMTVIRLDSGARQTLALPSPPLGVAFTRDNLALVVTSTQFLVFEPETSRLTVRETIADLTARTLPVPPANFPPQIVAASMAASSGGERIYGLTDTFTFRYDGYMQRLRVLDYTSEPPQGPRVVSVSRDGAYYLSGWALNDSAGTLLAQFPDPAGLLNVGSHTIDSDRGLVYAQIPAKAGDPPVLMVADADNLTVRERFNLPENLAGKSVLSSDGAIMYSISDSGLMALPVGAWETQRRIVVTAEQLLFRSSYCDRQAATQEVWIEDASGGHLDFSISGAGAGINVSPSSGSTPALLRIRADPNAFTGLNGTAETWLDIRSSLAINLPPRIRVLLNLRAPDQHGTVVEAPGKLVDILADPGRDRFYILRQDQNQVLVYDGSDYHLITTLRTGNTPTQMAITFDWRHLLVGNDNSQIANVYDLESFEATEPIRFPGGHYPRSLAASGGAILAACRVAGPKHTIDRVDLYEREAVELPTLGVYENKINQNTVLAASPNGSSILAAQPDGNLMLYDATADTFTASRDDLTSLGGAYGASSYDLLAVDNMLLNSSLVPVATFDKGSGKTSGFTFADQTGFLTTAPSDGPGIIQRIDFDLGVALRQTRMAEAPPTGTASDAFTRSLAALSNHKALVSLTTSGFTVLPWDYDATTAPPSIAQVVNAADFTEPMAPGGLMAVFGSKLSPVNLATSAMPLPKALGESCLTVNGTAVPMLFASPGQIHAQMPYETDGNVTLVLHTPGGVSDSYRLQLLPAAPSVFRSGVAGPLTGLPTIVRAANNQLATVANPIHRGDTIVVYLTGLGRTTPSVATGSPAPVEPPARAQVQPVVTLGGFELPVAYAGLTPTLAGVYQIHARVLGEVPAGMAIPLTISQGDYSTTIPVRVVR